jgi:hypothetical protein
LNGKRATTYWKFAREFAKRYPQVKVEPDPISDLQAPMGCGGRFSVPQGSRRTSIVSNCNLHRHRTGFESMRLMLRLNGFDFQGTQKMKFQIVMNVATGKYTEQEIADWLQKRYKPHRSSLRK